MKLTVEDLEDPSRFRHLLTLPYGEIVIFVIDYIRHRTNVTLFYWSACLISLGLAITVRINIAGYYEFIKIFSHTLLGIIIFPVLIIPVHEFLHIIPLILAGIKNIRVGTDFRQFIFFVTAHREVIAPGKFKFVALVPFITVSVALSVLIFYLPGLWKWSLSLFLFVHLTMCAGDFAMLNYYYLNRHRRIYTWDDVDMKEAYFYEEI